MGFKYIVINDGFVCDIYYSLLNKYVCLDFLLIV